MEIHIRINHYIWEKKLVSLLRVQLYPINVISITHSSLQLHGYLPIRSLSEHVHSNSNDQAEYSNWKLPEWKSIISTMCVPNDDIIATLTSRWFGRGYPALMTRQAFEWPFGKMLFSEASIEAAQSDPDAAERPSGITAGSLRDLLCVVKTDGHWFNSNWRNAYEPELPTSKRSVGSAGFISLWEFIQAGMSSSCRYTRCYGTTLCWPS